MSTVEITYTTSVTTTDITNNVEYATARFESQLAAQPGQFEFTVKDPDRVLSFSAGNQIRLRIDGVLMYGGYVFQVEKRFAFPVDRTDQPVRTRLWVLRGVDYNILFDRRFLFNVASPRQYIPTTSINLDGDILQLMTSSYLDLSDDDIDTTTHVFNVGDPQAGTKEYGFNSVGSSWRKEMGALSAKTGAIYYLAPGAGAFNIDLYYRGRETVTPGWGFSDTPNGVTTFGFRELDNVEDVSNLVNDGLVWGGNQYGITGTTGQLTFGRSQDPDSIADLFRSQRAEPHFGDDAYVSDADALARANTIVWGRADADPTPGASGEDSADPARGLRFPQRQLRLSWFGDTVPTVLIPGSVVSVALSSFSETITLPVRSISIGFESPEIVRYNGLLGIQTDDPFTLWAYMKKVADAGGTTGSTITPVSDGTSPAVTGGTAVCMATIESANGSRIEFTVTDAYQPGSTRVWVNGLRWRPGLEYTESGPTSGTITFYDAPLSGDQIWICYTSSGL